MPRCCCKYLTGFLCRHLHVLSPMPNFLMWLPCLAKLFICHLLRNGCKNCCKLSNLPGMKNSVVVHELCFHTCHSIHHGIMLVGSSGTGKSSAFRLFFCLSILPCSSYAHCNAGVCCTHWIHTPRQCHTCVLSILRPSKNKIFTVS